MLVVETLPPYDSRCYFVSQTQLKQGMEEFNQLLKRVAYHEMFGYEDEIKFV